MPAVVSRRARPALARALLVALVAVLALATLAPHAATAAAVSASAGAAAATTYDGYPHRTGAAAHHDDEHHGEDEEEEEGFEEHGEYEMTEDGAEHHEDGDEYEYEEEDAQHQHQHQHEQPGVPHSLIDAHHQYHYQQSPGQHARAGDHRSDTHHNQHQHQHQQQQQHHVADPHSDAAYNQAHQAQHRNQHQHQQQHYTPGAHSAAAAAPAAHHNTHAAAAAPPARRRKRRSAFARANAHAGAAPAVITMQAATRDTIPAHPAPAHVKMLQPERFRTLSVKLLDSPVVDMKWSVKTHARTGHYTQHVVFALTAQGRVYRSQDGGHAWEAQSAHMHDARVLQIIVSKADASVVVFRCAGGVHWFTLDAGASYHAPREIIYLHNNPKLDSDAPFFGGTSVNPLSFLTELIATPAEDPSARMEDVPEHAAESVTHMAVADFKLHPTQPRWMLASAHSRGCAHARAVLGPGNGGVWVPGDEPPGTQAADDEDPSAPSALCYQRLLLSLDGGHHWKQILSHVVQFDWGPAAPAGSADEKLIYATGYLENDVQPVTTAWDPNIHLMSSRDFFVDAELEVPHGNRFFAGHGFLFVAADDVESELEGDVALWIRHERGGAVAGEGETTATGFTRAHIPVGSLDQFSYTILDTSEGQAFLHINHAPVGAKADSGHLYVSETNGTMFAFSLPNLQRSASGHCAFAKVQAIEGVFLANFVPEPTDTVGGAGDTRHGGDEEAALAAALDEEGGIATQDETAGSAETVSGVKRRVGAPAQPKAHTSITFNKGAEWFYLAPPSVDSLGRPIVCQPDFSTGAECHLHLHGLAADEYGPFYSDERAPGLILATGSVGHYVHQHLGGVNTYISRDAGLTWHEAFKGSHVYEIGDQGGLLVMAPDTHPTQTLYYSWDEGATWEGVVITSVPFVVENIVVEPDNTNVQFVVYGYIPESANKHYSPDAHAETGARANHDAHPTNIHQHPTPDHHAGAAADAGVVVFVDFADLHRRECTGAHTPGAENSDYELWSPHDDERHGGQCLMGRVLSYTRRKQFAQCFNPMSMTPAREVRRCACTEHDYQCDYGYMRAVEGGPCVRDTLDSGYASYDAVATGKACRGTYLATKGYRRVPGNVCVGGAQWEPTVKACPSRVRLSTLLVLVLVLGGLIYALVHYHQQHDLAQLFVDVYDRFYGYKAYALVAAEEEEDEDDDVEGQQRKGGKSGAGAGAGAGMRRSQVGKGNVVVASAADDDDDDDDNAASGTFVGGSSVSAAAPPRFAATASAAASGLVRSVAAAATAATAAASAGIGRITGAPTASGYAPVAGGAGAGAVQSIYLHGGDADDAGEGTGTDSDAKLLSALAARGASNGSAKRAAAAAASNTADGGESSGAEHIALQPDTSTTTNTTATVSAVGPLKAPATTAAPDVLRSFAAAVPLPPKVEADDARARAVFDLLEDI